MPFHAHLLKSSIVLLVLFFLSPVYAWGQSIAPSNCQGGTIDICGVPVPMPNMIVGTRTDTRVPPELLGDAAATANIPFTVECIDNGIGIGTYRVANLNSVSCNAFPCQTSSIRICDTPVSVPGGTSLGGVRHIKMAPPGSGEVVVECLGNQGNPPVYQIVDRRNVVCPSGQTTP